MEVGVDKRVVHGQEVLRGARARAAHAVLGAVVHKLERLGHGQRVKGEDLPPREVPRKRRHPARDLPEGRRADNVR